MFLGYLPHLPRKKLIKQISHIPNRRQASLQKWPINHFSTIATKTNEQETNEDPLIKCLTAKIEAQRKKVSNFRKEFGGVKIGEITVNQLYGGMRGMLGLITETSLLCPEHGIRFRNLSVEDCQKQLPKVENGSEPMPEGMFWLLLTGEVPTHKQVKFLSSEWARRSTLPTHVDLMLDNMPKSVHPMTQLSAAVCLCNADSKFVKALNCVSFNKKEAWKYTYEDAMDLIARLIPISAKIYLNTYKNKLCTYVPQKDFCWARNFCEAIEMTDPQFIELMRLYFSIHSDHEGGNVSAHATHMVGSTLADPYLSFSAGLNGLAGPLHGLANQEVLAFLNDLRIQLGDSPSDEEVKKYILFTLEHGKVIPGFGHAVLRKTDPRYTSQREFALKHLPDDPLFKLVGILYTVVPPILKGLGKVQNPWPNVDAHSGVLLQHYGLKESTFYTVLFGMSRALGCLASLIWDRALLMPIERPKSITTDALMQVVTSCTAKNKSAPKN